MEGKGRSKRTTKKSDTADDDTQSWSPDEEGPAPKKQGLMRLDGMIEGPKRKQRFIPPVLRRADLRAYLNDEPAAPWATDWNFDVLATQLLQKKQLDYKTLPQHPNPIYQDADYGEKLGPEYAEAPAWLAEVALGNDYILKHRTGLHLSTFMPLMTLLLEYCRGLYGHVPSIKGVMPYPTLVLVALQYLKSSQPLGSVITTYLLTNAEKIMPGVRLIYRHLGAVLRMTDPRPFLEIDFLEITGTFGRLGYPGCIGAVDVRSFKVVGVSFHLLIVTDGQALPYWIELLVGHATEKAAVEASQFWLQVGRRGCKALPWFKIPAGNRTKTHGAFRILPGYFALDLQLGKELCLDNSPYSIRFAHPNMWEDVGDGHTISRENAQYSAVISRIERIAENFYGAMWQFSLLGRLKTDTAFLDIITCAKLVRYERKMKIDANQFCEAGSRAPPQTVDYDSEPQCAEMTKTKLSANLSSVFTHAFDVLDQKLPYPKEDDHHRQTKKKSKRFGAQEADGFDSDEDDTIDEEMKALRQKLGMEDDTD